MKKTHILKTDPEPFQAVIDRLKKCEIRLNDREFEEGDEIVLHETRFTGEQMKQDPKAFPLQYTGRFEAFQVTHILAGPIYGLAKGWVIMSID